MRIKFPLIILTLILIFLITSVHHVKSEEIASRLDQCIQKIARSIILGQDKQTIRLAFDQYIDRNKLGQRTFGGNWDQLSQADQNANINSYFSYVWLEKSLYRVTSRQAPTITTSLTVAPGSGLQQLLLEIKLNNGKILIMQIISTNDCKIVDLGGRRLFISQIIKKQLAAKLPKINLVGP